MRNYYFQCSTEDHGVIVCGLKAANQTEAQLAAAQLAYPQLWDKLGWLPCVRPADEFGDVKGWMTWLEKVGDKNRVLKQLEFQFL